MIARTNAHKSGYKWQVREDSQTLPISSLHYLDVHVQKCSVQVHVSFCWVCLCVGDKVQHHHGHTRFHRLSQCLLFGRGMVGVGVLVEGRKQGLQGRLGGGGRGLLQWVEVCGGVGRRGAVTGVGRAPAEGGGG